MSCSSLLVNGIYYFIKVITLVKSLYTRYIVGSYEQVYQGQIVQVRLFNIPNNTIDNVFSISLFKHLQNFATWLVHKGTWYPAKTFDPEEIKSASCNSFYEFTFWNGKRKLIRTSGTVPNPSPPPLFRAGLDKKVLHVSLCGHDVTDFVNRYVCSLTKDNEISANDMFELALLDKVLPKKLAYQRNHVIESEFIRCDEVIEKTQFKGLDVVYFNG